MIKIMKLKVEMVLIIMLVLVSNYCVAHPQEELFVTYQQPIILELSAKHTNRISFAKERIVQMIGETNYLTSVISEDGKSLFLTTKVGASELGTSKLKMEPGLNQEASRQKDNKSATTKEEQQYINVSVVTASREILDFSFKVVDSARPKLITLTAKDLALVASVSEKQLLAKQLIKDLINDNSSKYYELTIDRKSKKRPILALNNGQIVAFLEKSYRYGELIGHELKVQNKSHKWQMLDLVGLKKTIPNLMAVRLVKRGLSSKEMSRMWLVIRDKGMGQ
jgi:hypothetical protein